jgi:hypothetical protein
MLTAFTRDLTDYRRPLREALRERPGKPLKLRLQPTLLRRTASGQVQYRAWPGIRWAIEATTVAEATACCEALRAFFHALNTSTPEHVAAQLRALSAAAGPNGHHGHSKHKEVPA